MMNDIIQYVMTNWEAMLGVLTAVVAAASLIANLTPNETDNKIVAAVSKLINLAALNLKKKG